MHEVVPPESTESTHLHEGPMADKKNWETVKLAVAKRLLQAGDVYADLIRAVNRLGKKGV